MRYTVTWTAAARAHLATLWMQAHDRRAFSDATNRLDVALGDDPEDKSAPLGSFRVYVDHPIAVLFHLSPNDRLLTIIQVRRSRA